MDIDEKARKYVDGINVSLAHILDEGCEAHIFHPCLFGLKML